ncbi:MAG: hypothetical protein JXL85_07890 [Bacilli bacterium]|nr:hypothetical protein [Bacilli bacterium]
MILNSLLRTIAITDTISDFVATYVDQIMGIFNGLEYWLQAVALLVLAIFTLIGIFVFLKKFIKLFLVLAVIGAIGYVLYSQGLLDGILNLSASITSIFIVL